MNDKVYKVTYNNRKRVYKHRLVWERAYGPIPDGCHIHHINGDPHDNRLENLKCVTRIEHNYIESGYEFVNGQWTKLCSGCNTKKPINCYDRTKNTGRVYTLCIECKRAYTKKYRKEHPERSRELAKKYAAKRRRNNPEYMREYMRKWWLAHPGYKSKQAIEQRRKDRQHGKQ
jgi:hypothetical protein